MLNLLLELLIALAIFGVFFIPYYIAYKKYRKTINLAEEITEAIKETESEVKNNNDIKCPHCRFLNETFMPILRRKDSSKREYYLMTEVFVYLHDGNDFCNFNKKGYKK